MSYCNPCNTCNECTNPDPCDCTTCCTCSSTACPVNLDTDCAFYLYSEQNAEEESKLTCLGISKGTSLTDILVAIDTRLCELTPTFSFGSYNLPCLRADYVISDFQTYIEAVDTELCEIKNTINNLTSITGLQTTVDSIITPNLPDCGTLGITPADSLFDVLNKHSLAICALQAGGGGGGGGSVPLIATNSPSIEFTTSGVDNHLVTADVKLSSASGNSISIVSGGLYVPPTPSYTPTTISQCVTSNTINQNVSILGNNYTICNEVNIPGIVAGGGIDPNNCLQIVGGKLYVDCAALYQNNYISNIEFGPLIGGMSVSGVNSAFSGIIDFISVETDNTLSYSAIDGKLFSPPSSRVRIDGTDSTPSDDLDDKFGNPISDLAGQPGIGGWVGTNAPLAVPPVIDATVDEITIGGGALAGTYAFGPTAITDCQSLVDALNAFFPTDAGFLANGVEAGITNLPNCDYGIFNIPGATSVSISGEKNEGAGNVPWTDVLVEDTELPNPNYFTTVYKKEGADIFGGKTLEFYAYEPPAAAVASCAAVDPGDITVLFYNTAVSGGQFQNQILYLDIAEPVEEGVSYIIDLEEDRSGNVYILKNHVVKAGLNIIPLHDYLGGDIDVTVVKDCGCCNGGTLSSSTTVTLVGSGVRNAYPGPQTSWAAVPPGAFLNGWTASATGVGLEYKIDNTTVYFRGGIEKTVNIPTTGIPVTDYSTLNEDVLSLSLIDPIIAGFVTADIYHYGITDAGVINVSDNAGDAELEAVVKPHMIKDGTTLSTDIKYFNQTGGILPTDVEISMSSIVVRD